MLVSEFTGPGTAAGHHKACGDGYLALYLRAPALFRDLALAPADGDLRSFAGAAILADLPKGAAFVLGQSSHRPVIHHQHVNAAQRYQARSFVLVSQLPVARWQEQIGDPTVAGGIPDRLVHNAHRVELRGEPMRKVRAAKTASWLCSPREC